MAKKLPLYRIAKEVVLLCTEPQVLLVENEKSEAFIQKNKFSFGIMGEVTSTAKNQRRTNKWMKVVYHMIIVPKIRRKVVYGKLRKDIGEILRRLCDYKHFEIIEVHAMPDHIHMLQSIPSSICVSQFMGYLK